MKFSIFILLCLIVFKINAQNTRTYQDTTANQLSTVIVTSVLANKKLKVVTDNIQVLSKKELEVADGLNYSSILNNVPGVFIQSGALNTNRITIRGIGARSPFGTTGIRAYFGEIPLTDGNGASAIEDFELGGVSSIEIHKGPSGSSFGVGLGGTIILKP